MDCFVYTAQNTIHKTTLCGYKNTIETNHLSVVWLKVNLVESLLDCPAWRSIVLGYAVHYSVTTGH